MNLWGQSNNLLGLEPRETTREKQLASCKDTFAPYFDTGQNSSEMWQGKTLGYTHGGNILGMPV